MIKLKKLEWNDELVSRHKQEIWLLRDQITMVESEWLRPGAHPENFKGGCSKKTRSRTQERIQKFLVGGIKF